MNANSHSIQYLIYNCNTWVTVNQLRWQSCKLFSSLCTKSTIKWDVGQIRKVTLSNYQDAELPREIKEEFCIVTTKKKMRMLVIPANYKRCFYLHGSWAWIIQLQFWLFGYSAGYRGEEIAAPTASDSMKLPHALKWNTHIYTHRYLCRQNWDSVVANLRFCSENECTKCNMLYQCEIRIIFMTVIYSEKRLKD